MELALKPSVVDGQDYVDEYAEPGNAMNVFTVPPRPVPNAVRAALGQEPLAPLVLSFDRLRLRWMKPTESGRLVRR